MNPTIPEQSHIEQDLDSLDALSTQLSALLCEARNGHEVAEQLDDDLQQRLDLAVTRLTDRLLAEGGLATLVDPMHIDQICSPAVSGEVSEALGARRHPQPGPEATSEAAQPDPFDHRTHRRAAGEPGPNQQLFEALFRQGRAEVILEGTSRHLPVLAAIELIGEATASGLLCLRTPHDHLSFEFMFGSIVATSSDCPPTGRRLGDLVVAMGFVSAEAKDEALAEAIDSSSPLGAVLVRRGLLTVGQLTDALFAQTRARFDRVMQAESVDFAFQVKPVGLRDGHLQVSAHDLLTQAGQDTPTN